MAPVTFPDDFAFWLLLVISVHPSSMSLLLVITTMLGTTGDLPSSDDFVSSFAFSIFKSFTKKVDDVDEIDMVGLLTISCGMLVFFVMVKSSFSLVMIKILKIINRKRTDRV